jgi:membrane-associated phospholipid phosphatase
VGFWNSKRKGAFRVGAAKIHQWPAEDELPAIEWLRVLCLLALLLPFPASAGGQPVIQWNRQLLEAIRTDNSPPTLASRNLAILHTAIYDAVNSIEGTHQPYRFMLDPEGEASAGAAVAGAGHAVLVLLYPQLRARFDQAYEQHLAATSPSEARTRGLALGNLAGGLAVNSRSADGSTTDITYIPSDAPGQWRRTPPFFRPPLDPHWGWVEAFCLPEIETFLPPGPPELGSREYARQWEEVKSFGGMNSAIRTPEQAEMANFWSDFSYTATPPGHWLEIAAAVVELRGNSLAETARLFALASLAQADAAIVTWEAKYRFNFWRPVTAIRRGAEDGNPLTLPDLDWESFLLSPPFPEYPSGHSAFSMATAAVLAGFYGTDAIQFTARSDSIPGVFRSFDSLAACAAEVGVSRIYGGIHFMSANVDGGTTGARIGQFVHQNFLLPNAELPTLWIEEKSSNTLRLRLHGELGKSLLLEASADLMSWQAASRQEASAGGVVVEVSMDQPGQMFFRLRSE